MPRRVAGVGIAVVALAAAACSSPQPPSARAGDDGEEGARAPALGPRAGAEGAELIGQPASEWQLADWLGSEPLTLGGLRGKVVLVRWWTAPDCPFCAATAPSLAQLHAAYAGKGLVVIGAYHHKSDVPLRVDEVARHRSRLGLELPVAIDHDWRTLRRWWLSGHERAFTSVSFLVDRRGRIRHIHPGGTYAPGDADHVAMKAAIEVLLAE